MSFLGKEKLLEMIEPFRRVGQKPDCIVALSGGRDSSYGLHYAQKELGLKPIAFTYDWGMISDIGRLNQALMVGELGVEHIVVAADLKQKRQNIKRNIEAWLRKPDLAMVPLFMAGDKMADVYAKKIAAENDIQLVLFCRGLQLENDDFKWGYLDNLNNPTPKGVIHDMAMFSKLRLLARYGLKYLENPSYFNSSFLDTAKAFAATYFESYDFKYLWHFIPWLEDEIVGTLINQYGWETHPETDLTWRIDDGTSAFYNYIYYSIGGFTENDAFRSNQIREGLMTREKALSRVKLENQPRHTGLSWYFEKIGLNKEHVLNVIDNVPKLYQGEPYSRAGVI